MMEEVAEAVGLRGHLVSRGVNEDVARDVGLTYDKSGVLPQARPLLHFAGQLRRWPDDD